MLLPAKIVDVNVINSYEILTTVVAKYKNEEIKTIFNFSNLIQVYFNTHNITIELIEKFIMDVYLYKFKIYIDENGENFEAR